MINVYRRYFRTSVQEENFAVVPAAILVLDVGKIQTRQAVAWIRSEN
jgi:hypothetical protein